MATTESARGPTGQQSGAEDDVQSDIDMILSGLQQGVREQCRRRPYVTLGVSAAVGYVLGGGLPKVVTTAAVTAGVRYAIYKALRDALAYYAAGATPSESSE